METKWFGHELGGGKAARTRGPKGENVTGKGKGRKRGNGRQVLILGRRGVFQARPNWWRGEKREDMKRK